MVTFVAARVGSELASRSREVMHVAGRLNAFVIHVVVSPLVARLVWWVLIGACTAAVWWLLARAPATNGHGHVYGIRRYARLIALLVIIHSVHGAVQWQRLANPQTGEFSGVAYARSDPHGDAATSATGRSATTLVVEVGGENFRLVARGSVRGALHGVRMGDALLIDATRTAHDPRRLRFVAGRHVQGDLREVTVHSTARSLAPWHLAANRVHQVIEHGSRVMHEYDASLVRGLVLGDESRQPSRMTEAFRAAGLGHLLAVSGQNVVLLLAALTPGLERLTRWWRLTTALGIVAMFALVTRLESSVIRACVMAAVVQVGFAIGRDVTPLRALALTVTSIVTIDPLATWSIGFVLSVAATAGLVVITPWLGESVFAATVAAQFAVAPFVLWWFGSIPSISLITNLLAVPVASFVMVAAPVLLGVAAFANDTFAGLLAWPVAAAVRWVWWVAEWGTRLALPVWANLLSWVVIVMLAIRRVVVGVRTGTHPRARL